MRAVAILAVLSCVACLRSTQFTCDQNADCSGGRCEPVGFCSFVDPECPGTMHRFTDAAGTLAGTCVQPDGGIDAGVDMTTDPDALPVGNCPGNYSALANGTLGHRYRLVADTAIWSAQVTDCDDDGGSAYLGTPAGAAELAAMSGLNGSNKIWLGIGDSAAEGVFVTTTGGPQTFLPWKSGSPNPSAGNDQDCVAADSASAIIDDPCDQEYEAVCECEE